MVLILIVNNTDEASAKSSVKGNEDDSLKGNEDEVKQSNPGFFSWVYNAVTEPEQKKTRPKPANLQPTKYEILRNTRLVSPHLVVVCYGTCFIDNTPAKMYITPQYFCLSIGFPGFTTTTRKIYPISKLILVKVTQGGHQESFHSDVKEQNSSPSSLSFSVLPDVMKPSSILLSFFPGNTEEVALTPAVLDCHKLRILITELKEMELFEYTPVNSDFVST